MFNRESLEEKIARVLSEEILIQAYNPAWPGLFEQEKRHLLACLPGDLVQRIEHFGSTAVPGLCAKPIIDMLVSVTSLEETKTRIVPILESQGYDYFWRPTWGDDTPPFYAWFIKRDERGRRTHHIHMVEAHFEHWDRLLFRDALIENPGLVLEYARLKQDLARTHAHDRVAYTRAKTNFIEAVTRKSKTR